MTINPVESSYIAKTPITKNSSKELKEKFSLLKEELGEKIKNEDKEPAFMIGNSEFTIKEWDDFLKKFDKQEEAIQKEIEEEAEESKEEAITDENVLAKLLGDRLDEVTE